MSGMPLSVAIIGGGMGGLCLAQGLKKAGIDVTVHERDASADARPQGYRIHINPEGSEALHACLPPWLWKIFDATGGASTQSFTVMTEQLKELLVWRHMQVDIDPVRKHRSISRITLRRVLLAGLEDAVYWERRFVRYETLENGRVRAFFAGGEVVEADVLVGADGVNSGVRRQLLPGADPVDTGVVGLGGTIPLTDKILTQVPSAMLRDAAMVLPPAPCSLFVAPWRRPKHANEHLKKLGILESPSDERDYLICALGGRPDFFGLPAEENIPGKSLKVAMRAATANWHPRLRTLIENLPEEEIFVNRLRTSKPQSAWNPSQVTLLGDAIHNMTPYRGIGGNIALKDASLLCVALTRFTRGEQELRTAIGDYETAMRKYGFAAVADSYRAMEQFTGPKQGVGFAVAKAGMRTANILMKLRSKVA